jgi:hypothetical protein
MNSRKRTPFGEATANIGNRDNRQASTPSSEVQKPSMLLEQAPPSSMRFPSNSRSRSRPPRLGETPPRLGTAKVVDVHDGRFGDDADPLSHSTKDAARAREYKAQAFEAGIRVASQEQRIIALLAELEEVKLFQRVEFEGGSEAGGVEAVRRNDAELIETLAMELEIMERDLNQTRARVVELERDLIEARSESANQRKRWDQREAELTKQLERQKLELDNAIKDARDGVSIVRELDGALRSTRTERNDARSQVSALRAEIKQMKDDAERMDGSSQIELPNEAHMMVLELSSLREEVVGLREGSSKYEQSNKKLFEEMEMAKESLQIERSIAISVLSSLREEADSLRERLAKNQNLEHSNKELQSFLKVVQSHSDKKMNQMKEAMKGAQEREERIKQEHERLRQDFLRQKIFFDRGQKNQMYEMKSAYELSSKTNEVGKEPATKKAANEEQMSEKHESNLLQNAESKISSLLQEETLLSANASPTEKLQRDLTMAQRTDVSLAKAVLDCKVPLTVPLLEVLSGKPLDRSEPQEMRNIEDDALKEYCLHRFG